MQGRMWSRWCWGTLPMTLIKAEVRACWCDFVVRLSVCLVCDARRNLAMHAANSLCRAIPCHAVPCQHRPAPCPLTDPALTASHAAGDPGFARAQRAHLRRQQQDQGTLGDALKVSAREKNGFARAAGMLWHQQQDRLWLLMLSCITRTCRWRQHYDCALTLSLCIAGPGKVRSARGGAQRGGRPDRALSPAQRDGGEMRACRLEVRGRLGRLEVRGGLGSLGKPGWLAWKGRGAPSECAGFVGGRPAIAPGQ